MTLNLWPPFSQGFVVHGQREHAFTFLSVVVSCKCIIQPVKEFGSVSNILSTVGAGWARHLLLLANISLTKIRFTRGKQNLY